MSNWGAMLARYPDGEPGAVVQGGFHSFIRYQANGRPKMLTVQLNVDGSYPYPDDDERDPGFFDSVQAGSTVVEPHYNPDLTIADATRGTLKRFVAGRGYVVEDADVPRGSYASDGATVISAGWMNGDRWLNMDGTIEQRGAGAGTSDARVAAVAAVNALTDFIAAK